ncbi:MAG: DegT/DnrJ/EryC1/StrS family aminotransferase [Nitrospiraceae bacterium]
MNVVTTCIPHNRPLLGREELDAVTEVLRTGQLAQGTHVEQFQRTVAAYIGITGGVAVNSGTVALELALLALGVSSGDEVIVPSYVCPAPWLAVTRVGAKPRIVDIEPGSYNIDPEAVQKAMTGRTRAVIAPHLFGLPADLTRLQAVDVPLIEDCAQTLGATERSRPVGTVGRVTVCSFYATKLLCAGEGGMVLSNDPSILERVRLLRQYDETPSLNHAASNHKMSDLHAAVGLSQLRHLSAFLERRAWIAAEYNRALAEKDVAIPVVPPGRTHVYYRYVVQLPESGPTVGMMYSRLERQGIQCRKPVFRPLHRYLESGGCPASDAADQRALSIPIYPAMTDDEVARVIHVLNEELK